MYGTKAAVYCIRLFKLDVKVIVLGKIIYCIGKALGPFHLFGLDDTFSLPVNMSLKYSGIVPFLYLYNNVKA